MSLYSVDRYPWVVTWTRHVHSGVLAGLTVEDRLFFVSEYSAKDYAEFLNRDGIKKDFIGVKYTTRNVKMRKR